MGGLEDIDLIFDGITKKWVSKKNHKPKKECFACNGVGHIRVKLNNDRYKRVVKRRCTECFGDGYLFVDETNE